MLIVRIVIELQTNIDPKYLIEPLGLILNVMPYKLADSLLKSPSPQIELAVRRALFILALLIAYLLFGAIVLLFLGFDDSADHRSIVRREKLDFERNELISVLWAETLGMNPIIYCHRYSSKLRSIRTGLGTISQ